MNIKKWRLKLKNQAQINTFPSNYGEFHHVNCLKFDLLLPHIEHGDTVLVQVCRYKQFLHACL